MTWQVGRERLAGDEDVRVALDDLPFVEELFDSARIVTLLYLPKS
jgi:hypothetical protein